MTDAKIDDYSGKIYNPEDELTYTLEVKVKRPYRDADGQSKERTERLFFELNHDSFMATVVKMFEGKKILERWEHWENPTEAALAKYPNLRGRWVRNK